MSAAAGGCDIEMLAKTSGLRVDARQRYTTGTGFREDYMAMTMLQIAGATPTPATMADGVLVIIDAQREYTDGLLPLSGVDAAVASLAVLLDKARKAQFL